MDSVGRRWDCGGWRWDRGGCRFHRGGCWRGLLSRGQGRGLKSRGWRWFGCGLRGGLWSWRGDLQPTPEVFALLLFPGFIFSFSRCLGGCAAQRFRRIRPRDRGWLWGEWSRRHDHRRWRWRGGFRRGRRNRNGRVQFSSFRCQQGARLLFHLWSESLARRRCGGRGWCDRKRVARALRPGSNHFRFDP